MNPCVLACGLGLLLSVGNASAIVIDINHSQEEAILPNHSSNPYSGVAYIPGCSATPIADRLVLTAAHCIPPGQMRSFVFIPFEDKPDVLHCGSVVTYPGYDRSANAYDQTHVPDLALVMLDLDLPEYVRRYRLAPLAGSVVGAVVELVGYGLTGTGATGQIVGSNSTRTKRYVRNEIDRYETGRNFFSFDFDGGIRLPPCDKACVANGGYGPGTTVGINRQGSPGLGPIEGAAAPGDSGGPAFFNPRTDQELALTLGLVTFPKLVPDEPFVLGVTSYQRAYSRQLFSSFGTVHMYVNVLEFRAWLRQFAEPDGNSAALTVSASRPEAAASTLPSEDIAYRAGTDPDLTLMLDMAGENITLGQALAYCESPQQLNVEEEGNSRPDSDGDGDAGGDADGGADSDADEGEGADNGGDVLADSDDPGGSAVSDSSDSAGSDSLAAADASDGGGGVMSPCLSVVALLLLLFMRRSRGGAMDAGR